MFDKATTVLAAAIPGTVFDRFAQRAATPFFLTGLTYAVTVITS
ncbi:hypothetical protein [Escherichia coli]